MQAFKTLTSTAVPLPVDDIDTDQIIPARFLKATSRDGFGDNLFRDWRFDSTDSLIVDFPLNNPVFEGQILVTGSNFGCGSSREHAAWAIGDYGFRVVISSFFADIFKNNALNNGILPVQLEDEAVRELLHAIQQNPNLKLTVDLENQVVTRDDTSQKFSFEINPYKKLCLLNGFDDLDYLLSKQSVTSTYAENMPDWRILKR
ncbi:3-isopropylmalate dehydratase small subunit [bacterium]|nr:MAG: 3-isopropylmalate dehydratase small subunit [bacterium]